MIRDYPSFLQIRTALAIANSLLAFLGRGTTGYQNLEIVELGLERRTYLISTIVAFCFLAELVSLLLFIYNAEQMSSQFVGAMCATGVLNVNPYGWPTLYLKIGIFFAGAAWLTLNRIDTSSGPRIPCSDSASPCAS